MTLTWQEQVLAALALASLPDRIRTRIQVDPLTDCWLWLGCKDQKGYGQLRIARHSARVHRVVWVALGRKLPLNGVNKPRRRALLDHLCLNKSCCFPGHLELVTVKVNTRRHHQRKRRISV